jgi:hypothetical protein
MSDSASGGFRHLEGASFTETLQEYGDGFRVASSTESFGGGFGAHNGIERVILLNELDESVYNTRVDRSVFVIAGCSVEYLTDGIENRFCELYRASFISVEKILDSVQVADFSDRPSSGYMNIRVTVIQRSDERGKGFRVAEFPQRAGGLIPFVGVSRFQLPNEFVYSSHRSHHDY